MLPNQNTDGSYICIQYLSHQAWRMRALRRYTVTLRPTYASKRRTRYPLPMKLGFTSGLICMCTCRAQHPLLHSVDIRSYSDPNFPYILNNNDTTNKVSFEALPTHIIAGPYANTFECCSHLHKRLHPLYCYLAMAEKEKILPEWALKLVGGGEVGEATTPFIGRTRSEVGVAPTGTTPKQNPAKISQLLAAYWLDQADTNIRGLEL